MRVAIVGPVATEDIAPFLDKGVSGLPPGYAGAPLLATLIGELLERGHEVLAVTTSNVGVPVSKKAWVSADGKRFRIVYCSARARAFRYSEGHLGRAADFFSIERAALKNAILSGAPDVVHAHWCYEFGLAAIGSRLPHVITCHDAPQEILRHMPSFYRLARYLMARRCLGNANVVTAVSPYIKDNVVGLTSAPVDVIPNPLPNSVFAENAGQSERSLSSENPLLAVVINGWGRLKNAEAALRAFKLIRDSIPSAQLNMYGTDFGIGEAAYRWAVDNSLNHGVSFVGRVPHTVLQDELKGVDILIHPSLLEGCPMGIAEALAAGLPVVGGVESGGVPWVVGKGGALVNVRSPEEIANAVIALLKDRQHYADSSRQAISRSRQLFRASTITAEYEKAYRSAIEMHERVFWSK